MKRRYLQNSETKLSADTKYINKKHWLPLDNSAIIHLASRCKGYTNTFRLAVTLNEKICPETLQSAVNHITPRFPAIVAGIHSHALPYMEASAANISFEYLIQQIAVQINEQTDSKHLSNMISANVRIQSSVFYRILPLLIKNFLLHLTFRLYGERNSCLSFSNLGEITYPKELEPYIYDTEFLLTPRKTSAYNCSVVLYSGKTCISFTRKGNNHDLEEYFFDILENIVETHRKGLS